MKDIVKRKQFVIAALFVGFAIIIVAGLRLKPPVNSSDAPQPSELSRVDSKRLLDLPKIALLKRVDVEKIVGKPLSYKRRSGTGDIGDSATYTWGELLYAKGHLIGVIRKNAARPYQAALAELGLPDSPPYIRTSDGNMIWAEHPFGSVIHCCDGLAIHTAFLAGDFSEFHIWILDADDLKGWTDEECLMWLKFSGSPIPEPVMRQGNPLYWPLHHDNTPQACRSQPE